MRTKRFIIALFVLSFSACIEEFEPDFSSLNEESRPLVVEAVLDPRLDVQSINISRSKIINETGNFAPVINANVEVWDDQNNCYAFEEVVSGTYQLRTTEMSFQDGISYKLYITTAADEEYESSYETLPSKPEIGNLQYRFEKDSIETDEDLLIQDRVNIYEAKDGNIASFFRYQYESTFEYRAPDQGSLDCWRTRVEPAPESIPASRLCYFRENGEIPLNVFSKNDAAILLNDQIRAISLPPSVQFYYGNNMLVRKEAITESFFNYLDDFRDQNSYGGDLFLPPPTEIKGNVVAVDRPDEIVFGYFSVINSAEKRIFLNVNEIRPRRDGRCYVPPPSQNQPVPPPPPWTWCCDCILYPGATDIQPDYWFEGR